MTELKNERFRARLEGMPGYVVEAMKAADRKWYLGRILRFQSGSYTDEVKTKVAEECRSRFFSKWGEEL